MKSKILLFLVILVASGVFLGCADNSVSAKDGAVETAAADSAQHETGGETQEPEAAEMVAEAPETAAPSETTGTAAEEDSGAQDKELTDENIRLAGELEQCRASLADRDELLAKMKDNPQDGGQKNISSEEVESIIASFKEAYICPKINVSMAEAEAEGALCPQGRKLLGMVEKMAEAGVEKNDVIHLVNNYKIQGRSMVNDNGNVACIDDDTLKNEFFIMSYCPYGVRYVDSVLHPMIDDLGSSLDWTPYYIMQKNGGKLSAMHGQKEVDENLRQICVRDKWGADMWLSYMDCFSSEIYAKSRGGNPKSWQYCAEQAGIPADELQTCFDEEAAQLAEKDLKLSSNYGARGSPTAVFNCNKNIVGAIPYDNIKPHLCKMYEGDAPATCN